MTEATTHLSENALSAVQSRVEEAAKEKVEMIVVGRRGLSKFKHLLLDSVSAGVVNHANCTVVVVR